MPFSVLKCRSEPDAQYELGGPISEALVYFGHRRPAVQVETAKLVCSRPRNERTVGRMHGRESVAVTILTTRRQRGEHARKRETVRPDYVVAMCYGGKGNAGIRRPGRFRFRPVVWFQNNERTVENDAWVKAPWGPVGCRGAVPVWSVRRKRATTHAGASDRLCESHDQGSNDQPRVPGWFPEPGEFRPRRALFF